MKLSYKTKFNKFVAVIMCMVSLISFLLCQPVEAGNRYIPKEFCIYTSKKHVESFQYVLQNLPDQYEITNIKCKPKNIATVSINSVDRSIMITPKKDGKFTLETTIHSEFRNITKTYKTKVKVYKYINPCKSFKINGKEMRNNLKYTSQSIYRYNNNRQLKIEVSTKAGWKIKRRAYYRGRTCKVLSPIENTIFADKDQGIIQIDFQNKRTKIVESILISTTK